jgi:hypothetical protein
MEADTRVIAVYEVILIQLKAVIDHHLSAAFFHVGITR